VTSDQLQFQLQPIRRRLEKYRCTKADVQFRCAVKRERGKMCEACSAQFPRQQLQIHHILETRIYPEFARERFNVLVLCSRCHSAITWAEAFSASAKLHFYSQLTPAVRNRHFVSLENTGQASPALLSAFRDGNSYFWGDRLVEDLIR
jgi:hypothetical protein